EAHARLGATHVVCRRNGAHDRVLPGAPPVVPVIDRGPAVGIPVVDLARRAATLEPELSAAVARVVASGQYLLGPELDALEAELVAFTGRRHAVGVASGTDALRLTFLALGLGPGDEVLVPASRRCRLRPRCAPPGQ